MKLNPSSVCALAAASFIGLSACKRANTDTANSISINGSDTMLQVGIAWADAYKSVKPDVTVTVNGEGSGTGIKAMINGTVEMAQSSRAIKDSERKAIKEKHGKDPVEHIVGYDGIAVFVHKDNPVKSVSLPKLQQVWAEGGSITNWSALGGSNVKITLAGRSNSSGTHAFFKKTVCGPGKEFREGIASQQGSAAVVDLCKTTPSAMGYSGMGYKNDHVGWLSVSKTEGGPAFEPTIEAVGSGDYPIARPLYIYTIGEPTGALKEYLDWMKSEAGQAVLAKEKFVPLPN